MFTLSRRTWLRLLKLSIALSVLAIIGGVLMRGVNHVRDAADKAS